MIQEYSIILHGCIPDGSVEGITYTLDDVLALGPISSTLDTREGVAQSGSSSIELPRRILGARAGAQPEDLMMHSPAGETWRLKGSITAGQPPSAAIHVIADYTPTVPCVIHIGTEAIRVNSVVTESGGWYTQSYVRGYDGTWRAPHVLDPITGVGPIVALHPVYWSGRAVTIYRGNLPWRRGLITSEPVAGAESITIEWQTIEMRCAEPPAGSLQPRQAHLSPVRHRFRNRRKIAWLLRSGGCYISASTDQVGALQDITGLPAGYLDECVSSVPQLVGTFGGRRATPATPCVADRGSCYAQGGKLHRYPTQLAANRQAASYYIQPATRLYWASVPYDSTGTAETLLTALATRTAGRTAPPTDVSSLEPVYAYTAATEALTPVVSAWRPDGWAFGLPWAKWAPDDGLQTVPWVDLGARGVNLGSFTCAQADIELSTVLSPDESTVCWLPIRLLAADRDEATAKGWSEMHVSWLELSGGSPTYVPWELATAWWEHGEDRIILDADIGLPAAGGTVHAEWDGGSIDLRLGSLVTGSGSAWEYTVEHTTRPAGTAVPWVGGIADWPNGEQATFTLDASVVSEPGYCLRAILRSQDGTTGDGDVMTAGLGIPVYCLDTSSIEGMRSIQGVSRWSITLSQDTDLSSLITGALIASQQAIVGSLSPIEGVGYRLAVRSIGPALRTESKLAITEQDLIGPPTVTRDTAIATAYSFKLSGGLTVKMDDTLAAQAYGSGDEIEVDLSAGEWEGGSTDAARATALAPVLLSLSARLGTPKTKWEMALPLEVGWALCVGDVITVRRTGQEKFIGIRGESAIIRLYEVTHDITGGTTSITALVDDAPAAGYQCSCVGVLSGSAIRCRPGDADLANFAEGDAVTLSTCVDTSVDSVISSITHSTTYDTITLAASPGSAYTNMDLVVTHAAEKPELFLLGVDTMR